MDATTEILSSYSCGLTYEDLGPEVVHQVKRTVVDTLGCAAGGYPSEPGEVARRLAGSITSNSPARILGTHQHSSPDMAGFANGVMIRYLDCNDSYFSPGGGHPSDMIAAALALAGPTASDGKSVITAIVLAYEVFGRLSDQVLTTGLGWDQGMFSIIGATCAAGKILGLDQEQLGQAISLAVTPNLPLGVTRTGELSMWKGCATASATRAGIFAAQLAELGMTGPGEPFEGRRGLWEQGVGQPVHITPVPQGWQRWAGRGRDSVSDHEHHLQVLPLADSHSGPRRAGRRAASPGRRWRDRVGARLLLSWGRQHPGYRTGEVGPKDARNRRP